jgi:hypothetical protein
MKHDFININNLQTIDNYYTLCYTVGKGGFMMGQFWQFMFFVLLLIVF